MLKKIPLSDPVVLAARISSASKNPMELHGISLDILNKEFFDIVYTDENDCNAACARPGAGPARSCRVDPMLLEENETVTAFFTLKAKMCI